MMLEPLYSSLNTVARKSTAAESVKSTSSYCSETCHSPLTFCSTSTRNRVKLAEERPKALITSKSGAPWIRTR